MSSRQSTFSASKTPIQSTGDLPKGVVLDKDGKPCRLCTSAASWRAMTKKASSSRTSVASSSTSATATAATATAVVAGTLLDVPKNTPKDYIGCPPDVESLGRSTWTFLHSLTAAYPTSATPNQQSEMANFLSLFSRLYPCWVCADDLRQWMDQPDGSNSPRLKTRAEFGTWMCEAHNEVNRKLGKPEFDCRFWEQRWRTGAWGDGRCD